MIETSVMKDLDGQQRVVSSAEAHSESNQTFKMEIFTKLFSQKALAKLLSQKALSYMFD